VFGSNYRSSELSNVDCESINLEILIMTDLFWYQREVKYNKKLTPEKEGDSTSEVVTKTVWDCFNVNKVVRVHHSLR